ncbi:MAG: DUF502 domain-containing protein [Phycisphaerae bacterium]|nr:DUF502 domain-containing protein [Phycisphaerae bacterium]
MTPVKSDKPRKRRRSRIGATIIALLRTRITTGVLTILPILLTIWIVRLLFIWMRDASQWAVLAVLESDWFQEYVWKLERPEGELIEIETFLEEYPYLDWGIAIFSVLVTIFLLYVIGLFAANIVGRRVINLVEHLVDRVPLIKAIYRLPKQIIAAFAGEQTQRFQRAVLVPFPQEKMRCVGFITNIFTDSLTGDELCSVFIPTTPNPTTGYLQILKRKELTELNWSIEDAIRIIMSGGILRPDFLTIVANKDLPQHLPPAAGAEELPPPGGGDN